MKKFINAATVFVFLMLLVIMCAESVWALDEDDSLIASGTCGDNLVWEIDDEGTLTISGSDELNYNSNNSVPWNDYAEQILSVNLDDMETTKLCSSWSQYAFGMLKNIKELKIPEGVVSIPASTYLFPDKLPKLIFPSTYSGDLGYWYGRELFKMPRRLC